MSYFRLYFLLFYVGKTIEFPFRFYFSSSRCDEDFLYDKKSLDFQIYRYIRFENQRIIIIEWVS